jgi:hypothetical protein
MKRALRFTRLLAAALVAGALFGCAHAPTPLYQWDTYQKNVYQFLKHEDANPDEQMRLMQAQAEKSRIAGTRLPPGFRAHLGMLYLQLGQDSDAKQQLQAEKEAFPESAHYMDFLLKQMDGKKS